MANKYMKQFLYSSTPMLTSIHGNFVLASSTTGVTASNIKGATAARTGVGEITLTLDATYPAFMAAKFTVLSATAQDRVVQIATVDVTSAKTILIRLLAGATATDPASACTVYVDLYLRNSSVAY